MSTISDSQPFSPRNRFSVRAYLAGSGATIALIAAAILAFVAITALVAFNGLPFGAGDDDGAAVPITPPLSGAPEAAALAAGSGASAAVASAPAEDSALPAPRSSAGAGTGASGRGPGAGGSPAEQEPGTIPGTGPAGVGGSDVLGGTVGTVEQTANNLGLNAPLSDATQSITQPVDKTLNQTLNGVGGAVGNPKLGDQAGTGVNDLTKKLLP